MSTFDESPQPRGNTQFFGLLAIAGGILAVIVGAVQTAGGDPTAWIVAAFGAVLALWGISAIQRRIWGTWVFFLGLLALVAAIGVALLRGTEPYSAHTGIRLLIAVFILVRTGLGLLRYYSRDDAEE